jgi:Xaa-Pro aminopeptidase
MDTATRTLRREALRGLLPEGAILLLGNGQASRNYEDNAYPFRQDSHFLYFAGIARPDLALLLLPDGTGTLYGPAGHPDDVVWSGPQPSLGDLAARAGIARHAPGERLAADLAACGQVHYLPPYRASNRLLLAELLGLAPSAVAAGASRALVRAVVALREIKSDGEVAEIETALGVSALMYQFALRSVRPGLHEAQIAGAMLGVALSYDMQPSFQPIVSVRGEILHNESRANTLEPGQLLLLDSGVETSEGYCSDITRTIPAGGVFAPRQRDVYDVVLAAQAAAIEAVAPGATNRDVHLAAALAVAGGLKDLGLMRGDPAEATAAGAHALFFPHGIGHMLGLDVHDMEDLGDAVGYDEGEARSPQFGLNFLRLAKALKPGFVITIEPGIYFNPALIARWQDAGLHGGFIDYAAVRRYAGFGGIRLEDDVLVTADGNRVLGAPIPKTADDVELVMGAGD